MADLRIPIGATFETVLRGGATGLSPQYRIDDNQGVTVVGPTGAGIVAATGGIYSASPTAPGTVGQWSVVWSRDGSFDPDTIAVDSLTTYDPGASSPSAGDLTPISGDATATVGPCQAWTTSEAVAECCDSDAGSDVSIYDDAVVAASQTLYALVPRFSGECGPRRVRPCGTRSCFWPSDLPVAWTGAGWELITQPVPDSQIPSLGCGCSPLPYVPLAGWVREILEVTIDGQIIDSSEYRVDENRRLVRVRTDSTDDPVYWPSCQDMDLPETEPGTFSILYTYGVDPPAPAQMAARELACAIYKTCSSSASANDADCVLPNSVVRIQRQGITLELKAFTGWGFDRSRGWATGMPLVDMFLNSFNPQGRRTGRTSIWSPDLPRFPRPLGDSIEAGS